MKFKSFLSVMFVGFLATSVLSVQSCKDDDDAKPAPTVTLTSSSYSGKIGETATVGVAVVAPEGLKSLVITKYLGTTVDATYGTNGSKTITDLTYEENYVLNEEGLDTPVRFKFEATDNKGQVSSADFIITTEPSVSYLLVKYNWQWKSKFGQGFASEPGPSEQIQDFEKDNIYIFNADGTMSIDYGALTGSGGGTCPYDGLKPPTTWSLNADESELTIISVNVFDPMDTQTEVYKITSADATAIKSTQTVDLTVLGGIVYDWTFEWSAKPK